MFGLLPCATAWDFWFLLLWKLLLLLLSLSVTVFGHVLFFVFLLKNKNRKSPFASHQQKSVFRTVLMKFQMPRHDGMPKQNKNKTNGKIQNVKGHSMKIDCLQRSVYDKSITGFIHIIAWWNKPIIRDEMKWDLLNWLHLSTSV